MSGRSQRLTTLALAGLAWGAWAPMAGATPTQPGELVNPLFDPTNCEFCHLFPNAAPDADAPPYAPLATWQGTLMANSARDPVFWAGVAVADQDAPGQTELCIRCHAPRAFLDEHGGVTTQDALTADERSGVECMLCHRMMDDPPVPAGNAMYTIDDVVVGTNVPRRGPWDFTDGVPEPPHSWIADPYTGSSRMCGTCHDVTTENERVDDAGVGLGIDFNEQRTYSEWAGSSFAVAGAGFASCVDCHMPEVPDMPGCTAHANQYSHAEGGRRHDLVGANRFVVSLLQQQYGSAGANLIADVFFETTIARMDEFLPTAATLEAEGPAEVDLAEGVSGLTVTVTNNTGHKLPTGYSEGRVMWLEVLASYGGEVVASSGAWDPDRAAIQDDPQLRTYEAIGEDYADGANFHLLRNNHWVVDSRIPPLGLLPDIQTDPVGARYVLQGDGTWPNFDTHAYTFDALGGVLDATPDDPNDDVLTVTVRLRYLINTAEYIEFLGDEGATAGADLAALFDLNGGAPPVTLGEVELAIPIVGFGAAVGTSGTSDSSSGASTGSGSSTGSGVLDSTGGTTVASNGGTTLAPAEGTGDTGTQTGDPGRDGDGDDGGGGCSCRTGPRRDRAPWAWLPIVLLALRRRR